MSKHTQGKWEMDGPQLVGNGYGIGSVNSHNSSEGKANATLIAAAPDLLAALEVAEQMMLECVYIGDATEAGGACLAKIRAAIARAKGEPV